MTYNYLSQEFLKQYEGVNPFPTDIGEFTYMRTYSRYLPEEGRRETWLETVARAVDYNVSLGSGTVEEAEKLFHNIFNLRQFLSGRTLWIGGTEISKEYPMANYNCAFVVADELDVFHEIFYLLLLGAGVGFKSTEEDVSKLPRFKQNVVIDNLSYLNLGKLNRATNTWCGFKYITTPTTYTIEVGDSKEGWVDALSQFLKVMTVDFPFKVDKIELNYSSVRPKGERLKRFGGYASGHEAIELMFTKIAKLISNNQNDGQLTSTEVIDLCNIIGEAVVSGGVRRTAQIALVDKDDTESVKMKNEIYFQDEDDTWIANNEILHRQMSNNSIVYYEKPSREQWKWHLEQMRYSGEPGFINAESASKRRNNFRGVNPCAEILLDSRGMCNLTEVVLPAFINSKYKGLGGIRLYDLEQAQRMSTRAGIRMTLPEFEMKKWNDVNVRDRLIGLSLTGWQDFVNKLELLPYEQIAILKWLKAVADSEAKRYAKELGINEPLLKTTIKPSGTLSLLPTVSSGVHLSHSEYYIRRIRVNAHDPIALFMMDEGVPWNPEVGQTIDNMKTVVFDFPVKAPSGKTKSDVGAIEQLETYKMFMTHYVDHNVSITVHVKPNEWEQIEQYMWDNWDDFVAVSFIPYDDAFYDLMPYESISKEKYEEMLDKMPEIDYNRLKGYESGEDFEIDQSGCEAGICPIR